MDAAVNKSKYTKLGTKKYWQDETNSGMTWEYAYALEKVSVKKF